VNGVHVSWLRDGAEKRTLGATGDGTPRGAADEAVPASYRVARTSTAPEVAMDDAHPHRRNHRIAAAFADEADADAALADLRSFREVVVDVHLAGCHDVDEAERGVGIAMLRCILVAIPVTIVSLFVLCLLFNPLLGDMSVQTMLAVAIGPGAIAGILLGGIAGIALSERQFDQAISPSVEHRAEEVLVAHVQRGAIHNPNIRRVEFHGRRDRDVVGDLEDQVRAVFEAHHGQLIDA
jgi:hypothetical protein